jgi:hypothetical protein
VVAQREGGQVRRHTSPTVRAVGHQVVVPQLHRLLQVRHLPLPSLLCSSSSSGLGHSYNTKNSSLSMLLLWFSAAEALDDEPWIGRPHAGARPIRVGEPHNYLTWLDATQMFLSFSVNRLLTCPMAVLIVP